MTVNKLKKSTKIIGLILVKNEEYWIEQVVENIIEFCDKLIILDNLSSDHTWLLIKSLSNKYSKISKYKINSVKESQSYISQYAGTDTWVFAVDGDELYDPRGLVKLKKELIGGRYDKVWNIMGNVVHCTQINKLSKVATGYMTPPSRSMTKLYNFSLINRWDECPERLHSGILIFKSNMKTKTEMVYKNFNWNGSHFKCLHLCFIKRSRRQFSKRLNPGEIMSFFNYTINKIIILTKTTFLIEFYSYLFNSQYKNEQYSKGKLYNIDIKQFLQ